MGFEIYTPKRSRFSTELSRRIVRVTFRDGQKPKNPKIPTPINIHIEIGLDISDQLGFAQGEKITFFIDKDNPRLWLIKKSRNLVNGYTLSKAPNSLRLAFNWSKFSPNQNELKWREVKYDLHDGGLRIYGNVEKSWEKY